MSHGSFASGESLPCTRALAPSPVGPATLPASDGGGVCAILITTLADFRAVSRNRAFTAGDAHRSSGVIVAAASAIALTVRA